MVRHQNIIELIDHLPDGQQDDKHWVIMQLATGGELMQRIIKKFQNNMRYTEKEVSDSGFCRFLQFCRASLRKMQGLIRETAVSHVLTAMIV
jgi:hypothetical protein